MRIRASVVKNLGFGATNTHKNSREQKIFAPILCILAYLRIGATKPQPKAVISLSIST
jgi:hypothetical protein